MKNLSFFREETSDRWQKKEVKAKSTKKGGGERKKKIIKGRKSAIGGGRRSPSSKKGEGSKKGVIPVK